MSLSTFHTKSSLASLLANGRFSHILTPWHIEVNMKETYIKIKKRNWYLVGHDSNTYSFRFVRNIKIDTHLFGADIEIRITGGKAEALSIPKSDAKTIKELLLQYNNNKKGNHIVFH
jgi:hypothetical protein